MRNKPFPRILAIAPGTWHLGFALIENGELGRFGVKTFEGKKDVQEFPNRVEQYLDRLIDQHRPNMLAVEDTYYAQARSSPLLRRLIALLKSKARRRGIAIKAYSPLEVKRAFCVGRPTRHNLAQAISDRFLILNPFFRRMHGRRTCKRYWQQMFDAVALGAFSSSEEVKPPPRAANAQRLKSLSQEHFQI